MATETQTEAGLSGHVRGVTVTTLACLGGVAAAVAASVVVGTGQEAASDPLALIFMVAAVAVQYPVLRLIGVDVADFGAKDHLYVGFMTFTLWFITFAILLTTGASL
ncbi:EMC6-like membrane protein [Haloplanus aerogenes]|uniref:Uncharacterized protein n=1 Tax=Haloplanus aerogenes TaxID=660522 RepID=A0A3M0CSF6_9EURY|nr:hypothetical protein [Haloplanus aerogenes]AZH26873.1 hypothetical protein DU502_16485 [Haloplanus aerogenes]RMB12524.1 hypothetical protein ATH50_3188 [Haloplanus aerogenes]